MKDRFSKETIDDMCRVYGELMAEYEASRDYFEKTKIEFSMMSISHCLGIPFKSKHTSLYEIVNTLRSLPPKE